MIAIKNFRYFFEKKNSEHSENKIQRILYFKFIRDFLSSSSVKFPWKFLNH
jgi:hypothetical protein